MRPSGMAPAACLRVLGPVRVRSDGVDVAVPARMLRRLLCALAVARAAAPSRGQLVDALWGESPPPSADKILQQYVSQLRRLLPPSSICTTADGYALQLGADAVDAGLFERLAVEGSVALQCGDAALAASLLRRALDCWSGEAFGEFRHEPFALAAATHLEKLRQDALENRFDADLGMGRHAVVLGELLEQAAAHPLRERLQALAMRALYGTGQQVEALELFRVTRTALVEHLGVEPGPELRGLHRRVLVQDPELDAPPVLPGSAGLPNPINPLRGREREMMDLQQVLGRPEVRLVVLTGAGGSGKTRLALELARTVGSSFAHGCTFLELADVREPGRLLESLCNRLDVVRRGAPLEDLASAFRSREALLVLDNLEQVRTAASQLVELLERAPHLRFLVTSRVVLHVSGEHVYPVQPLPPIPAAQLLAERARGAGVTTPLDAAVVRALCLRLDGLPLAIELAAARLRVLTPEELLTHLKTQLPALAGQRVDLPSRQLTLLATLQWSHDLLDEAEQRALAHLSVFPGAFSLSAAAVVADVTVDALAALVDHSLVARTLDRSGSRYRLLETVRQFAAERLEALGSAHELRRRHAAHALQVAEGLGLSVEALGTGAPQLHAVATAEQADLRGALEWCTDHDPVLGLRLALALEQFWITTDPRGGARLLAALLDRAGDVSLELRARTLRDLGGCTEVGGDGVTARALYARSLALFEQMGDEKGSLRLQHRLANADIYSGDLDGAAARLEVALVAARAGGHTFVEADLVATDAMLHHVRGDKTGAYAGYLESLALHRRAGGWPWGEVILLGNLAELAADLGRPAEGAAHGRESLRLSLQLDDRISTVFALAALACVALSAGDGERAGRLWGAVEAEEQRTFLGRWAEFRGEVADRFAAATSPAVEDGRAAGHRLRLAEAVTYALDDSDPLMATPPALPLSSRVVPPVARDD